MTSPATVGKLLALFALLLATCLSLISCDALSRGPKPNRAWIAVSVGDDPVARTGPIEIKAGTPFTLHAVLQAGDGDQGIFYTEASALMLDGEPIAQERIRAWEGPERASILWFSVEGSAPVVAMATPASMAAFEFRENFRASWPRTWSIPGSVQPLRETAMVIPGSQRPTFGTMRFHVRVELFDRESEIRPKYRFSSEGADSLPAAGDRFPTVTLAEPGVLRTASSVFGLTQFEGEFDAASSIDLPSWVRRRIGFSRASVLKISLQEAGLEWEELDWRAVDIAAESGGVEFEPGALLRAGDRLVYLYRDRGRPGVGYEDLCLDFGDGARVLPLADVFAGSGLVELSALTK